MSLVRKKSEWKCKVWKIRANEHINRTLGGSNSKPTPKGKNDEVEVQYPLALAKAMIGAAKGNSESGVKIRLLFISGTLSERDQSKSLWFLEEGRKARVCLVPTGKYSIYL